MMINQKETTSTPTEPEAGRPVARQLPAAGVVLILLGALGFVLTREARSEQATPAAPQNPNVVGVSAEGSQVLDIRTGTASLVNLDETIKTTGLVSFPSDRTIKVAPRLTGRVREVSVKLGDHVAAGQKLATLESSDAASAVSTELQNQATLRQAKLDLERVERLQKLGTPDVTAALAAYNQAMNATKTAKDVLDLSKHQRDIGGLTEKPLEDATNALIAARSTLQQAQADLTLAQKDRDRKKKLLELGLVAQSDMEQSEDTYDKAQVNVKSGEDAVKLAEEAVTREKKAFNSHLYADQTIKANENAYAQALLQEAAAQKALQLAKAQITRDLTAARTAYAVAQYNDRNSARAVALLGSPDAKGTMVITSPMEGVVTERDVSPGQVIDQTGVTPWQMFVISNPVMVWVDADVHETDIAKVSRGSRVTITVAGAPGRTFEGSVFDIAPTLDKTSHAVKVRSVIPNQQKLLKDGMYAQVSLHVTGAHNAVAVPMAAVSHEQDGDYVYVPDGKEYRKQLVTLGPIRGDTVVVAKGVAAGERMVTHGALFLGAQVSGD
jgi:RND family efflux transporter MFP subunit